MIPVFLRINTLEEAKNELKAVDVASVGIELMAPKMLNLNIKLKSVPLKTANILKQEMLSIGGDAAVSKGALDLSVDSSDVILIGTNKHFRRLCEKLIYQPFGLQELSRTLVKHIENYFKNNRILKLNGSVIDFGAGPKIMGIVNITPDSFYDGGLYYDKDKAIKYAIGLAEEGADIIDIGGESTRPGSKPVGLEEELSRVLPVVAEVSKRISIPLSIDTSKSEVAARAVDAGAQIINDISGMQFDPNMVHVAAKKKVPVVLMHIKGTTATMQDNPYYEDVIQEMLDYFSERTEYAFENGLKADNIILDPGIGFGKRLTDNLEILKKLDAFRIFGMPLLVGVSRKSFIGKILNLDAHDRLEGSISAGLCAISRGADIIRVHDVKRTKQALTIYNAIENSHRTLNFV
ncbi:MAG TPA: dihydropteroate synthase [bacterium]